MPKAVVIDGPTDIRFIDRMTGENVQLLSEFILVVEAAEPVHIVQCDRCGKRALGAQGQVILSRPLSSCKPASRA